MFPKTIELRRRRDKQAWLIEKRFLNIKRQCFQRPSNCGGGEIKMHGLLKSGSLILKGNLSKDHRIWKAVCSVQSFSRGMRSVKVIINYPVPHEDTQLLDNFTQQFMKTDYCRYTLTVHSGKGVIRIIPIFITLDQSFTLIDIK